MTDTDASLLIVEDNKVNRLLLSRSVETQGHQVTQVENGRAALQKLRREPFDLMLLDIEMPEMDGFAVLEEMKADADLQDLPVIVTSSVEGLDNIVRCIGLGAEDYLPKPVNPVLLKARIDASLEKKRLRDELKQLLRRFATSEVAQDLQQSGFSLGGKRVHASVMFADIRGFTPLVENQAPEDTIELLNAYFALMFEAIGNHGGVVNQMIGDGLMALFGAPLPLDDCSGSAVAAALEMIELIEQFNEERSAIEKPEIRIGIGIATGDVVAGYTGTQERATYTGVGETVNLAARLEEHTKVARRSILIDESTQRSLKHRVPADALGTVTFKGKGAAADVFAVATAQHN